jgi:hypothetical protein
MRTTESAHRRRGDGHVQGGAAESPLSLGMARGVQAAHGVYLSLLKATNRASVVPLYVTVIVIRFTP